MPFIMCLRLVLQVSGRGSYTPFTIALNRPLWSFAWKGSFPYTAGKTPQGTLTMQIVV